MAHASLTFGEAYMDGIIEIQGDLQQLIMAVYQAKDSFLNHAKFKKFLPKRSHSEKMSKVDVQSKAITILAMIFMQCGLI